MASDFDPNDPFAHLIDAVKQGFSHRDTAEKAVKDERQLVHLLTMLQIKDKKQQEEIESLRGVLSQVVTNSALLSLAFVKLSGVENLSPEVAEKLNSIIAGGK